MNGDQLKQWREARGLTQTELSELLGVHLNSVSRWEVGMRGIPSFLDLALETIDRDLNKRKRKVKSNK
jgi:transcriptional regulator with XRE-family HTH domain